MAPQRLCSSFSGPLPEPIDFSDLTEEFSSRRSLRSNSGMETRLQCHLHRNLEKLVLVEVISKTLNSTVRATRNVNPSTSDAENRNIASSATTIRRVTRSTTRAKLAIPASKESNSNINNQCQNETINLDNTISPNNASKLICAICLGEIENQSKPTATCCGHIFCQECLNHAIKKLSKCPRCRASITKKSCMRLYF